MRGEFWVLSGLSLAFVACGPNVSSVQPSPHGSATPHATSAPAVPGGQPPGAASVLVVVADNFPGFGGMPNQPPTTLHFIREDGSEVGAVPLKPGVTVHGAGGDGVFVLTQDQALKVVRPDGTVERLEQLNGTGTGPGTVVLPSTDGRQWLWASGTLHDTVYLGARGKTDTAVAYSNANDRVLRPYRWTPGGAVVAHTGMGIGGYILFSGPFGAVDRYDPGSGQLVPLGLKQDCGFSDLAADGTIACSHVAAGTGSRPDMSLKIVRTDGGIVTVPVPAPYTQFGDAFFSPDARTLTLGMSPAQGAFGNGGEQFVLDLVNVADGSTRPVSLADVKPAAWLPDGSLVVYRPSFAREHSPATFLVHPDGSWVKLASHEYVVGYVTAT